MKKMVLGLIWLSLSVHAAGVYATFTVEAKRHADLAFTTTGTVAKVHVDIADEVHQGEVLTALKNDDLKAALKVAQVALEYARRDYERQKRVKKLVDAAQLDKYAFKYEHAKAQVAYQQALLDKTLLKAPFDGVVYAKMVEVGDVVSGAMIRTVMKVESRHARKLIVSFDQKYWHRVKKGDRFIYRFDGGDKEYEGRISKIYPTIDPKSRKAKAEVEVSDIPTGLFGTGTIAVGH